MVWENKSKLGRVMEALPGILLFVGISCGRYPGEKSSGPDTSKQEFWSVMAARSTYTKKLCVEIPEKSFWGI